MHGVGRWQAVTDADRGGAGNNPQDGTWQACPFIAVTLGVPPGDNNLRQGYFPPLGGNNGNDFGPAAYQPGTGNFFIQGDFFNGDAGQFVPQGHQRRQVAGGTPAALRVMVRLMAAPGTSGSGICQFSVMLALLLGSQKPGGSCGA